MKAQDLKNSILQLAIQGKLVPQNPNDESAEVLYTQIQAEKQKLIKEGKIKKDKTLPPITDDEAPFSIPSSWKWVRLSDIVSSIPTKEHQILQSEILNQGKYPVVSQSQQLIEGYSDRVEKLYKHERPVLIFGDHTRCLKLIDFDFIVGADGVKILYPYALNEKYLYYAIQYFIINMINRGYSRHFQFIKDKEIPLPPLAEQKRIVAKIEELEPLIKQYDKAETELSDLNEAFPEQLKKSILQYAIQGKLVPQDPNDEPADVLYEKIQSEKQQLIKEGKIKKDKPLPPITDDEIPFQIPSNWKWVRLGDIIFKLTDGTHSTPKYTNQGIPFISVKDLSSGYINFSNTKFISEEEHKILSARCNPERGDLLLTKVGTTGIPVIVDTDRDFSLFVSVALVKLSKSNIDLDFLKILILSPLVQEQVEENTKGVGNKNWVIKDIASTFFPLPPLAEQKRIVAKVNELMQYCDKLVPTDI